nr:substrate-binding domain-containing protein [Agromyces seonyuensis]
MGAPGQAPASTALHFNEAARDARYAVIQASMARADPAEVRAAAELLVQQSVEAVVVIAQQRAALDALAGLELGVPLVAIASEDRGIAARVGSDQFGGARAAVEHLIALGHTRVRHVAGPPDSMDAAERLRGWFQTIADRGLPASEPIIGDWSPASGHAAAAVIAADPQASAVFVANDLMALGLMHGLRERGIAVPGDVSVVGFDDLAETAYFDPPLTTVRQDFAVLGRNALTTALAVLGDEEAVVPTPAPTVLVERESTAARVGSPVE